MPRVSVVIPTYRRAGLLSHCLVSLKRQTLAYEEFEVLICDDAAESDNPSELRSLIQRFAASGMNIRYIPVTGKHGPSAARNRGWQAASAPIIAFTDDDTRPHSIWLKTGLDRLESGLRPSLVAISGRTIVPVPDEPTDYERNASKLSGSEFITANCFVKRSALQVIGGFDEKFTMPWREDSDLQFRLIRRFGEKAIDREIEAIVVHPIRPAPWGVALSQTKKAIFNALLFKKHPDFYRRRIRPMRPYRYYAMLGALLIALLAQLADSPQVVRVALLVWLGLVVEFTLLRLRDTTKRPAHVIEMIATSILAPPLTVFWRLYGAAKFRVAFF